MVSNVAEGTTLLITAGETLNGVDFTLVRGGVITGRVTDADGKAVIEERVMLTEADPPANRRRFYPLFTAATDDRGVYRMFGMPVGRYKVLVGRSDDYSPGEFGGSVYKRTYYPDVSDSAKATVVEVTEGSEASEINIAIGRATPTFAISGHVVDAESGNPIQKVQFGIQTSGERRVSYLGQGGWSNAKGEFRIEGLTPGKYRVFMAAPPESNLRADIVNVEVVDQEVTGVVIRTSKAASAHGTVALEDPDNKVARAKLATVELQFYVKPTDQTVNIGGVRTATINADGTFRVSGLESGIAYVELLNRDGGEVKGLTIVRIVKDGINQSRGLEIKPGENIADVQIIVSYGTGSVHGTVKLSKGALSPSTRFGVLITKLGDINTGLQSPDVDARGQFLVEGLSSGAYIFTVYMQDEGGSFQPRLRQQVNVVDGSTNEITFTIDTDAPPLRNPQ